MIPRIISISKSMACRLEEYKNLLFQVEAPCSQIKEVWAGIFHDLVVQNFEWQALWILSEEHCKKYDLIHPTAVIVMVENYDWDDMSATVTVTAVQDDIMLPSVLSVPVIDLHPIKDQDYDEDDLNVIADWLDKCRYFFKYLWYPWDAKVGVKISAWCNSHLENRLKMQCSIQNGQLERNMVQYYKALVAESKKIDALLADVNFADLTSHERVDVIRNCIQRKVIKMELNFLEEPDLRNDLMLLRKRHIGPVSDKLRGIKVVWLGSDVDDLISVLQFVRSVSDGQGNIKIFPTFQEAVDNSMPGDNLLLSSGSHFMTSSSNLQSGCVIKGLGNSGETVIREDNLGMRKAVLIDSFVDFEARNLTMFRREGTVIQIREGTLKLSQCRIKSDSSSNTRGIIVSHGCRLILENCEITGFEIGIVLQNGSAAEISDTVICNCSEGMKVNDESQFSFENVEISNSSRCAVRMQTAKPIGDLPECGSLDVLSAVSPRLRRKFQSVAMKGNKCHVVVGRDSSSYAAEPYGCDVSNDTITISDEETCEFSKD